jgi:hypothetical protein
MYKDSIRKTCRKNGEEKILADSESCNETLKYHGQFLKGKA